MSQIGSPVLTTAARVSAQEDEGEGSGNALPRGADSLRYSGKRHLDSLDVSSKAAGRPPKVAKYDLPFIDASILHQNCKSWVVFSDLHVKGDSIDTCEKVLISVHQAAVARQGGIIFLGDFWHVRRSLDVELLNRVLDVLRTWTCPVIMIPGNHDQVTLGGKVHSLKPLQSAFQLEQILIIDEPAICMGALWVPYRRDLNVLRAVLRAGADSPGVSMIFCHADVKGAYMNDNMRSKEGLDIASFPKNIPIYSGHFHKPHTICQGRTTLRYVGSPYQTSLSEAGQEKYFYCVQRGNHGVVAGVEAAASVADYEQPETWKEVERWVCDIGRKIFRASSPSDASISVAKAGDRVVVTVPTGQEHAAQVLLAELQERGIEVELKPEDNPLTRRRNAAAAGASSNDVVPVEEMDPLRIFRSFMSQLTSNPELEASLGSAVDDKMSLNNAAKNDLHVKVLEEGLLTLQRLNDTKAISGGGGRECLLRFETVTLSNFGPYYGEKVVEYPLSDRGLVLIKGQSTDGTGADSNGAGKTTLAMSVLWCLTGSLDARVVGDCKVADVTSDSCGYGAPEKKSGKSSGAASNKLTAEVIVKGTINKLSFEVIRRRCGAKSELHFSVDGKCLTGTPTDTQARINDQLGIKNGLLQRCCFFGQHAVQLLLGLTDLKLKEELSVLVDTSLWVTAEKDVRHRCKAAETQLTHLSVKDNWFKESLVRAKKDRADASNKLREFNEALSQATTDFDAIPALATSIGDLSRDLFAKQNEQAAFSQDVLAPLKADALTAQEHRDSNCAELDQKLMRLKLEAASLQTEKVAVTKAIEMAQKRRLDFLTEEEKVNMQVEQVRAEVATALLSFPELRENSDSSSLRKHHEQSLLACNAVVIRSNDVEASLALIKELCEGGHSCAQDEACPTCGQEMPVESRATRTEALRNSLDLLYRKKESMSKRCQDLCKLCEQSAKLEVLQVKHCDLLKQNEVVSEDIQKNTLKQDALSAKLVYHEGEENRLEQEKVAHREAHVQRQKENARALADAEKHLTILRAEESALHEAINISHQQEAVRLRAEKEVAIAQERVSSAENFLREKTDEEARIQLQLATTATNSADLTAQQQVWKRLIVVFGQRGIRNFVFQNVILQLESVANAYLKVLSEGGIQFALQNDGKDETRIVKSVWVRSKESDGEYRERSLAQLSGGQWRRVSLALEFAFVELIRRRGVLRSNLIVMDEVLTYLDASGRESVGNVLRTMAQGGGGNEEEEGRMQQRGTECLVGGGAYETVVVILQDLAAAELSESFDHVDVVVKESDRSTVVLDGEEI